MQVYKHTSSTPLRIVIALRDPRDSLSPMSGHGVLYVLERLDEGRPAGIRTGLVSDLWVREDLRRRGYGRMLLEEIHVHARRLGLKSLTLTSDRQKGRTVYEAMGYIPTCEGFDFNLNSFTKETW